MDWATIAIAPDTTHHVRDGQPLYGERFDEVLKFHPPGLAPVRLGGQAWHVDTRGCPAYARRFVRTFGFYEGRAAVVSPSGWQHILPDGRDLYRQRHAWCGNYQGERCTFRDAEGRYHHVDLVGEASYRERWRYAGDYRDGIAVVQANDGRSTHIDPSGRPIHDRWFLDLDVFHKGRARARLEDGWTHVDLAGVPQYAARFAAVEPFYNGQARVERFDGALEVIDEAGQALAELRPPLRTEFASLSGDMVGFWRTQTICTAVELGLPEVLPGDSDQVAAACGLTPERALRLLRALEELRLVTRDRGRWNLTARGRFLHKEDPLTLADAAVEYGRRFTRIWDALGTSLSTHTGWAPPSLFEDVAHAPGCQGHHRMLRSYARHDYGAVPAALPLRGDEVVIDAGGGLGVLASSILRHHAGIRVVLIDRPEVIDQVEIPADLQGRLTPRAIDLFSPWSVRGDAVVLARVLHDWDDAEARQILMRAHESLGSGGRVFLVEMLVSEDAPMGSLCDLHLLVATGGKERTAAQFDTLLQETGYAPRGVIRIPALPSIIVGEVP